MLLGRGSGSPAPCYFAKPLRVGRKWEIAVIKLGKDPIPASHLCCWAGQVPGGRESGLQPPHPDHRQPRAEVTSLSVGRALG